MIVAKIVNGAYKALRGDVPASQLPFPPAAPAKKKRGRKKGQTLQYRVHIETYTQLGYSGKTFRCGKAAKKGNADNSVIVVETKGRKFINLDRALARLNYLEQVAPNTASVVLTRLWETNPEKQVLRRVWGTKVKK